MPAPFDDAPLIPRKRYQEILSKLCSNCPEFDQSRSKERRAMYSSQQMSRLSASHTKLMLHARIAR
jgi:hypothetical protein